MKSAKIIPVPKPTPKPSPPPPPPPERRPRVDAQRNRERILDAARDAFSQHGAHATLDDIARRAEVGPGTLYRHFPTRDDLVEAVFRSEVDKLSAAAQRFSSTQPPLQALRSWSFLFIDYVATKLLILPALDTVPGGSTRLIASSRTTVHGTFHTLIQAAIASGDLRPSTHPDDLIRAIIGIFHTDTQPGWETSARRIVDILIEGSRQHP
jgi:AcrR family transcriptional regulator